jgi:hypothetical protein
MILVQTNHPYLIAGCRSWYQSIMGVIHYVHPYFQKPIVMIRVYAHIRALVVLTGDKLTGEFYFLYLFYSIYYSVMTHLWTGRKVSFLSPDDVNLRHVPSRWSSLEMTIHIIQYVLRVYHATGHDHTHRAQGPRNVLWMPSAKREHILVTYVVLSVQR